MLRYVFGETVEIDFHIFDHFFSEFANCSTSIFCGTCFLLEGLLDLGSEVLCEMEKGTCGGVLGVEVKLGVVDVGKFEFPEEVVLGGFEVELAHLKCHESYI